MKKERGIMAADVLNEVIHDIKMRLRDYVTDVRGKKITSTGHFKCPNLPTSLFECCRS